MNTNNKKELQVSTNDNISNQDLPVNRDFKGIWIPREIWIRDDINSQEKILWAEVHSLYDRQKGGCYASNDYLAHFIGVKERRLQEMMASLKEKGLIVQVWFDGRQRIIKAVVPPEDFSPCTSEVQKSAPQGCRKVHLSGAEKCTPPIYIDNKVEGIDYNSPPIPPHSETPGGVMSASADVKRDNPILSKEVEEIGTKMLYGLKAIKPDFVIGSLRALAAFYRFVDYMIRLDNRKPETIIEVFLWAISDSFWSDKMFKPNPAKYLREKFDQLEMKMKAKPPKKERKFAPSSDDQKALEMMEEWSKSAI